MTEKLKDLSKECTLIFLQEDNTIQTRQVQAPLIKYDGDRLLRLKSVRILCVHQDGQVEVLKDRLGMYNKDAAGTVIKPRFP